MPPPETLGNILRARIKRDGPISVEDWMATCLGDPQYGYYMTRDPLGSRGDFTTAPEISQMFGELLGLWAVVVWQQMHMPARVNLVELGPGRGTLMADALRAGAGVPGFLDAVQVHMVETSPTLKSRQRETVQSARSPVTWHADIDALPDGPMIVLANEFLDALPVRQYVYHKGTWRHRAVTWAEGAFTFVAADAVDPEPIPAPFRTAAEGAIYEDSPAVRAVMENLAGRLSAERGAALFVDYGHTVGGLGETLQAVSRHGYADPLAHPGDVDLTAHVDFAALAACARKAGAAVWGPLTQAALLQRLGIDERAATLAAAIGTERAGEISAQHQRLTATDAMGHLFKALAITHPAQPAPPSFETAIPMRGR